MLSAWQQFSLTLAAITMGGCAPLSQMQSLRTAVFEQDPMVGEELVLIRALIVPAGQTQRWFDPAFDELPRLSLSGVFQSSPARDRVRCGLQIHRSAADAAADTRIEPGVLEVRRVSRVSSPPGIDPATVSAHAGFASDVVLSYRIDIQAFDQPQVAALFCHQRHASLRRGTPFPDARILREQAAEVLRWPEDLDEN